jgi:exodeoxyribonuclease III
MKKEEGKEFTIVSWNVNGIRAFKKKYPRFDHLFQKLNADIICFQETKVTDYEMLSDEIVMVDGYESYWSFSRTKKGWSGVVTYARKGITINAAEGFDMGGRKYSDFNQEGRIVCTDHSNFVLFNIYFPNGASSDERQQFKMRFDDAFAEVLYYASP